MSSGSFLTTLKVRLRYLAHFGVSVGLYNLFQVLFVRRVSARYYLKVPKIKSYMQLRSGTSDLAVFEKIFLDQEYALSEQLPVKTIIDAGANTGASALFFAARYPEARILALEPEVSNFNLLLENCRGVTSIEPLRAALWKEQGVVYINNEELDSKWMFQVGASSESAQSEKIPATTIPVLLKERGLTSVDILKVDIEGAEAEVFDGNSSEWIPIVQVLMIEFHEGIHPGIRNRVSDLMQTHRFSRRMVGETDIFTAASISPAR